MQGRSASTPIGRSATVFVAGSTTQTAGSPSARVRALAGSSIPAVAAEDGAPGHGRAEPHLGGRVDQADAHTEGAGGGVGPGRDLAHAALGGDCLASATAPPGPPGRAGWPSITAAGTSKTASLPSSRATLQDHPAGLDDLARLGADGGDNARRVCVELGVVEPAAGDADLGLRRRRQRPGSW